MGGEQNGCAFSQCTQAGISDTVVCVTLLLCRGMARCVYPGRRGGDAGEKLDYPAHMSNLVRIASAGIRQQDCFTFTEIEDKLDTDNIDDLLLPIEVALNELPKLEIHDTLASRVRNGAVLPIPEPFENYEGPIAIIYQGKVIAIYKQHPTKVGMMKPDRVLVFE